MLVKVAFIREPLKTSSTFSTSVVFPVPDAPDTTSEGNSLKSGRIGANANHAKKGVITSLDYISIKPCSTAGVLTGLLTTLILPLTSMSFNGGTYVHESVPKCPSCHTISPL